MANQWSNCIICRMPCLGRELLFFGNAQDFVFLKLKKHKVWEDNGSQKHKFAAKTENAFLK